MTCIVIDYIFIAVWGGLELLDCLEFGKKGRVSI